MQESGSRQELRSLVVSAQSGDAHSYDAVVRRFQDMAVGYGYSLLGDFHWAEDAAQEAFIEAGSSLSSLREPAAFAGWLRAIVFKHCDRLKRKRQVPTVTLEAALEMPSPNLEPPQRAEVEEMKTQVRRAIADLPEHERMVTLLFYMSEYSQAEIADFLEVPVTTVKKRLHDARQRLKKRMIEMVQEELQEQRPSKDDEFIKRFHEMMSAVDKGDADKVRTLLQEDPALLNAKGLYHPASDGEITPLLVATGFDQKEIALLLLEQGADPHVVLPNGENPMQGAAFHQNRELADALVARGVQMDIFAAAGLGDVGQVQAFLRDNPDLVMSRDRNGATPLHWAGDAEVARVLLDAGADIEATENQYHNTPLEYASHHRDVVQFLISRGATVRFPMACSIGDVETARRLLQEDPALASTPNGYSRPEADTLPLSIAAIYYQPDMVTFLLDYGVEVNAPNTKRLDATALHFAARSGHYAIVELLLQRGADASARTNQDKTPLFYALQGQREGWGTWSGNPHPPRHQDIIDLLRRHCGEE